MSWISTLFGKPHSARTEKSLFKTDIHSHLIPGIDDGVKTLEESMTIIRAFKKLGIDRIVTTPHIMADFYKNSAENILPICATIQTQIAEENLNIQFEAAAEYYLDEALIDKLEKEKPLLTFGNKNLLFETSYINESAFFNTALFAMKAQGYKPILAHPERYTYLHRGFEQFTKLYDLGLYFQININSLCGYYGINEKKFAEKLIDNKMVDFIGSDCHGIRNLKALPMSMNTKYYDKLAALNILNDK